MEIHDKHMGTFPIAIAIVIPLYQGEKTLAKVVNELLAHPSEQTPQGHTYQIAEIVLVHDGAKDHSAQIMQELAKQYPCVKLVWLSRNFGQHPATLAGLAATTADWVVTLDEDGQQNPADIPRMLDIALHGAQLVYAKPTNRPPHSFLRNALSDTAKWFSMRVLGHKEFGKFNSFRLIEGEIARSLAAYSSSSVFLDIALLWIVGRAESCPVKLRTEFGPRVSSYSLRRLVAHFWRLILTSGTRPLRFISILGLLSLLLAMSITGYTMWIKFHLEIPVQGWASIVIVVSFFSGCILFALGIIAEYLAVALTILMGKPLYLVSSHPPRKKLKSEV